MQKCNHMKRSAKGDQALLDDQVLLDIIPEFRSNHPLDKRTDDELVEAFRQVLRAIPRNCAICTGGAD